MKGAQQKGKLYHDFYKTKMCPDFTTLVFFNILQFPRVHAQKEQTAHLHTTQVN